MHELDHRTSNTRLCGYVLSRAAAGCLARPSRSRTRGCNTRSRSASPR